MVFGKPVAGVTQGLGALGEIDAVAQGLRRRRPRRDRDEIEHG